MSLGTLAINNNSDQVAGTGTSFTTELKVNDFIAVPSGGVTYTMVVKAIASDTALTITRPFSGPNVTGGNWAAIPAGTMVGVTAKIADDTAYTMRMYVNEANNWMSLLTVDGDVTVYAPDGSSYTGPSWLKLSRIMGTLDMPALTTIAAQIHADAVQVASDTQTTAANTATATQAASTATTAAQTATQGAQTATTKAGEASASAITAKNEADRAATANPDNQLKKANNLSDVADISTARRFIGGNWEETQVFRKSEGAVLRRPSATDNQWLAFYREDNTAAIRIGHETNGAFSGLSYKADGTYNKKILEIQTDATVAFFNNMSVQGDGTFTGCTLQQTGYVGTKIRNTSRDASDTTATMVIEVSPTANARAVLSQRRLDNSATGRVDAVMPASTGVIQVAGTSGRDYKKDVTPADSREAIDRIMALDLVNFVYKDDEQERIRFGVIAEDAEIVAPQYIKHNQFPIPGTEVYNEEGEKIDEEYRDRPSVDVNPIVMDLLGAVQNLQNQIKELKETIAILSAK